MDQPDNNNEGQVINEESQPMDEEVQQQQVQQQEVQQQVYDEQQVYNYDEEYMGYQYEPQNIQQKQLYQSSQFQLPQLISLIEKKAKDINDITCLGFDWSMMLYSVCGWDQNYCNELTLSGNQLHKKKINYTDKYVESQGWSVLEQCPVCCEQNLLLTNICGHQCCESCWGDYLITLLKGKNQNPFAPCIFDKCGSRISYKLCQILILDYPELKQKFNQSLCRDYATRNSSVKVCKGRKQLNCTRCFNIKKLLDIIECQKCGNMACPRCGQRSHGAAQCTNLFRWKQLNFTTMGMVQYYNYQQCPGCKNGVERTGGCNEMKCKCNTTFCYICGQVWSPHHPNNQNGADYCPNFKKMQARHKSIKLRKSLNIIKFCFRIQDKRQQLQTLDFMFEQMQKLRQQKSNIIKVFLNNFQFHESQLNHIEAFCTFLKKAICILWGQAMNDYFGTNQRSDFFCKAIKQNYKKIRQFLLNFVQKMYKLLIKNPDDLTEKQVQMLTKQKKQIFYQEYFSTLKQLETSRLNIMRIVKQQFYCTIFEQK